MDDFKALEKALVLLRKSISEFPIGAVSHKNLKPTEEKIRELRESIKCLNTKIQMLRTATHFRRSPPPQTEADTEELAEIFNSKVSETIVTNQATAIGQQSGAVQHMFFSNDVKPRVQSEIKSLMEQLYTLNDEINIKQVSIEVELHDKQLRLRNIWKTGLNELTFFLKEQKTLRNKRFAESHPEQALKKERARKKLERIHIMKKLISTLISSGCNELGNKPELIEVLERLNNPVHIVTQE